MFIPGAIANDGHVEATSAGTVTGTVAGQAYVGAKPLVSAAAVQTTDAFVDGFRYAQNGALRVYDATLGVPADASRKDGIAVTSSGQVCYLPQATAGSGAALGGLVIDSAGRVYLNVT